MIKSKSFRGGYYFRKFKGAPQANIVEMDIPSQVVIPLKQGFGEPVPPIVNKGQTVKAGEIIGRNDDSISTPVHATVSGTVKEIKEIVYNRQKVQAVVIQAKTADTNWKALSGANEKFQSLSQKDVGRLLYESGAASLGVSGIPTQYKSSSLAPDQVKYIVVSGIQTDPFALPFSILSEGKVDRLVSGLEILRKTMGNPPVHIGLSEKERNFARTLKEVTNNADWLNIGLLKPKYPQENSEVLSDVLTGVPLPYGKRPDAIGAVFLDVLSVIACYEAVVLGKPLISRLVALGGTGYKENVLVRVRPGTLLKDIAKKFAREDCEKRYIFGNVLTGEKVESEDTPIGREVNAVAALEEDRKRRFLFFMRPGFQADSYTNVFASKFLPVVPLHLNTNENGEHRACIKCSACEEVCPRPLMPQLLAHLCKNGVPEEALPIGLMGCVECGLCSYVCPSKIPLMTQIQEGKEKLRKEKLV